MSMAHAPEGFRRPAAWRTDALSKAWTTESLVILSLIVVAVLVQLPYFGDPAADYDQQLYSLIGQRLLEGALPYVDLWDRKPVGLFLIFAGAHWLFGNSPQAYQVLGMAAGAIGAILLYRLSRNFASVFGAASATGLFLVTLPIFRVFSGQSEIFTMPVTFGMMVLLVHCYRTGTSLRAALGAMAAIMVLGGLLLQIKYTLVPQCVFFGLASLWRLHQLEMSRKKMLLCALLFALLGLAPTIMAALYFLHADAFEPFFYANFISIFERTPLDSQLAWLFASRLLPIGFSFGLIAILGVRSALARLEGIGRAGFFLCCGWTISAIVNFAMLGAPQIYYFAPVAPCLAVLASPFLSERGFGRRVAGIVLLGALLGAKFPVQMRYSQSNRTAIEQVTKLVAPIVDRENCLLVYDGPTILYGTTDSCVPTRFLYPDHLNNPREEKALGVDLQQEFGRVLAARPPAIVFASAPIIPRWNQHTLGQLTGALGDYTLMGAPYYEPRKLRVYIRNDLVAKISTRPARKDD